MNFKLSAFLFVIIYFQFSNASVTDRIKNAAGNAVDATKNVARRFTDGMKKGAEMIVNAAKTSAAAAGNAAREAPAKVLSVGERALNAAVPSLHDTLCSSASGQVVDVMDALVRVLQPISNIMNCKNHNGNSKNND